MPRLSTRSLWCLGTAAVVPTGVRVPRHVAWQSRRAGQQRWRRTASKTKVQFPTVFGQIEACYTANQTPPMSAINRISIGICPCMFRRTKLIVTRREGRERGSFPYDSVKVQRRLIQSSIVRDGDVTPPRLSFEKQCVFSRVESVHWSPEH